MATWPDTCGWPQQRQRRIILFIVCVCAFWNPFNCAYARVPYARSYRAWFNTEPTLRTNTETQRPSNVQYTRLCVRLYIYTESLQSIDCANYTCMPRAASPQSPHIIARKMTTRPHHPEHVRHIMTVSSLNTTAGLIQQPRASALQRFFCRSSAEPKGIRARADVVYFMFFNSWHKARRDLRNCIHNTQIL